MYRKKSGVFYIEISKKVDLSGKICYNERVRKYDFDVLIGGSRLKYLGKFLSYILIAVFAQNILLGKAIGMSDIFAAVNHKKSLPKLLILVGCWSTFGIMLMWLLSRFVHDMDAYVLIALMHSLIVAALYFQTDRVLARFKPEMHDRWKEILPHALINSIVVGAPLSALSSGIPNWYSALGCGIGSALGLGLGIVIIKNGMAVLDRQDIPKPFRGVPIMLIYIGILSLAFCAFL